MKSITVLIADDHQLFRKGLKAILEAEKEISVVAEAKNGRKALALCKHHKPDVVVMDIAMPEMGGILATNEIVKACKGTKILVLSMHLNETYIAETLRNGARGYVLKDCAVDELVSAIQAVNRGETYLSPRAATVVVRRFLKKEGDWEKTVFDILSPREQEILQLLAEGKSSKNIAEILFLSPKTVDNHRANIMRKLDVHDIPSLVKFAIRMGLSEA